MTEDDLGACLGPHQRAALVDEDLCGGVIKGLKAHMVQNELPMAPCRGVIVGLQRKHAGEASSLPGNIGGVRLMKLACKKALGGFKIPER